MLLQEQIPLKILKSLFDDHEGTLVALTVHVHHLETIQNFVKLLHLLLDCAFLEGDDVLVDDLFAHGEVLAFEFTKFFVAFCGSLHRLRDLVLKFPELGDVLSAHHSELGQDLETDLKGLWNHA